jgi:DNA-binding transcriptional LysR family regulator
MRRLPHSTLEQWGVLRAVIEHGGFAQAAVALNRSQSSVSYAVARLQEMLGVGLLELQGRRAVLTLTGTALLAEAIPLIDELTRLEDRGRAIAGGEAVRIRVLVDSLFPKPRLFDALQQFSELHPFIEIQLRETVRQTIGETKDEDYDLAVLIAEPGAKWTELIADIPLLAVAHAAHPLAEARRSPTRAMLARHPRVEIRGTEAALPQRGEDGRIWRMNTVEAAIEAVRRGLCYGWLPRHLIEPDLQEGLLVPLPLRTGGIRHIPLGLRFDDARAQAVPAIKALAQLLAVREDGSGLLRFARNDEVL